jgi:alkanesulfonate monooxygenase SsuD/methylene tetrahydromethanopterin reductase-like flavin-dependent oxidoreductase (luciferase family)
MLRLAALHADTWSWFAEERSDLAEFEPRLAALVDACVGAGRDPETIGKSAGLVIEPTSVGGSEAADFGTPVRGSPEAIADTLRAFGSAGFTNIELIVWPATVATVDAMAPVIELLDAD